MKLSKLIRIYLFTALLFSCSNEETYETTSNKQIEATEIGDNSSLIFLELIDKKSGRTVIIEEDQSSLWAYVILPNNQGIDFVGFICSTVKPIAPDNSIIDQKMSEGFAPPLTTEFANEYSVLNDLKSEDIHIRSGKHTIEVQVKNETYLVLDLQSKTAYSKAISKSGEYGEPLQ